MVEYDGRYDGWMIDVDVGVDVEGCKKDGGEEGLYAGGCHARNVATA